MSELTLNKPRSFKYRTDLAKIWKTDSVRFYRALADYAESDLNIKFVREGTVLFHTRRIKRTKIDCLRAFAIGLATANYDCE